MTKLIDLVESAMWPTGTRLPAWLSANWLQEHDVRLVCQLSHADDLPALRDLVPDTTRLIAYPRYPGLESYLDDSGIARISSAFMSCLGATECATLRDGKTLPEDLDFTPIVAPLPRRLSEDTATLALVTPMPPTRSGIANYCTELLPDIAEIYKVTLVVENAETIDASLKDSYRVIDHEEFFRTGSSFDRVMYHFGNSGLHYDYFTLLEAHPGVVVLHDAFLGDCIYSNFAVMGTSELRQHIYASHGWFALLDCEKTPRQAISLYPGCGAVLRKGLGTIVHNRSAAELLSMHFDQADRYRLNITPHARRIRKLPGRDDARHQLNIANDACVYASFGFFHDNKYLREILNAWAVSTAAQDPTSRLYLVGGCTDERLLKQIETISAALQFPDQIVLTEFVDSRTYDLYLSAADVALQLRRNSRGESSGAVLDCMAAGLPTIVNAHGSMAELPDHCVVMLPEQFSIEALAELFCPELPPEYESISSNAIRYVEQELAPRRVAESYSDFVEECYRESTHLLVSQAQQQVFSAGITDIEAADLWAYLEEFNDWMRCGGISSAVNGRQMLVDITALKSPVEGATGKHLAEALLRLLLVDRSLYRRVEPVYFDSGAGFFRYARTFTAHFLGLSPLHLADDPLEATASDTLLCLSLPSSAGAQPNCCDAIQALRGRGVKLCRLAFAAASADHGEAGVSFSDEELEFFTRTSDIVLFQNPGDADGYTCWLDRQEQILDGPEVTAFDDALVLANKSVEKIAALL